MKPWELTHIAIPLLHAYHTCTHVYAHTHFTAVSISTQISPCTQTLTTVCISIYTGSCTLLVTTVYTYTHVLCTPILHYCAHVHKYTCAPTCNLQLCTYPYIYVLAHILHHYIHKHLSILYYCLPIYTHTILLHTHTHISVLVHIYFTTVYIYMCIYTCTHTPTAPLCSCMYKIHLFPYTHMTKVPCIQN